MEVSCNHNYFHSCMLCSKLPTHIRAWIIGGLIPSYTTLNAIQNTIPFLVFHFYVPHISHGAYQKGKDVIVFSLEK